MTVGSGSCDVHHNIKPTTRRVALAQTERSVQTFPLEGAWRCCGDIEHVFTHFALTLTVWKLNANAAPSNNGWWAKKSELDGEALPTLFKKVLSAALS
ncbi:NUDIX domain-containing protein [Maritalea sp.]|uniref:NUDIX domain-containing protein n=1 Tax=Maritalea sp. TaxID=2003361 RepID=UPI0039E41C6A